MTKTAMLIRLGLFYIFYIIFLNIFAFLGAGADLPEIPEQGSGLTGASEALNTIGKITGFAKYGEIPYPLTFIISFLFVTVFIYFTYEAIMIGK